MSSQDSSNQPGSMNQPEAMLSVGVIGAGGWGKNHVRTFSLMSSVELRYVCDCSEATRARVAREHPAVEVLADAASIVGDSTLRAVVVATDAPSHFELARQALEAGKDVLVEKPMALSTRDAAELCELADVRGRILMVGHLLLYHPAVIALRERIEQGDLGDIQHVYTQRLNLGVVRQNENAWWSLAPHDISLANYMLGAEAEAVHATGSVMIQSEARIEDVVFASLHYSSNRIAHIHVSWLDPTKTRRLVVVGSKKMAVFDDTLEAKLVIHDKGVDPASVSSTGGGGRIPVRRGEAEAPSLGSVEPLRAECEAFVDAVRTRKPPIADGRSGLAVVRALEAGTQSMQRAGVRVELS